MSTVEFIWLQHCEICGRDHRHVETRCVASPDEAAVEAEAFQVRCAHWYLDHRAQFEARRKVARATKSPLRPNPGSTTKPIA